MIEDLNRKYRIILGSSSPRRKELLEELGLRFEIRKAMIEETVLADIDPFLVPEFLAKKKSTYFAVQLAKNELLITADTIVIINKEILGKPVDRNEAINMISKLSGKSHWVVSGVNILSLDKEVAFSERTEVHFRELSMEEIVHYVDQHSPYDKAGAYGIQDWIGLVAVHKINGCYYNVVGLPVPRLCAELLRF